MKTISAEDIKQLISQRIESDLPDKILAILQENNGKKFTKLILDKLPGGRDVWSIGHSGHMTKLFSLRYAKSQGETGYNFVIAHTTVNVIIDCNFIVEKNCCYFSDRKERNAKRLACLNDQNSCLKMAELINHIKDTESRINELYNMFEHLAGYDGMFSADRYELKKLVATDT